METASSTNRIEIVILLLNEGTDVVRPTLGLVLGLNEVQFLPTPNYDPTDEEWQFMAGTNVKCVREMKKGRGILVARHLGPHHLHFGEAAGVRRASVRKPA